VGVEEAVGGIRHLPRRRKREAEKPPFLFLE
jgi:hypothetical protein